MASLRSRIRRLFCIPGSRGLICRRCRRRYRWFPGLNPTAIIPYYSASHIRFTLGFLSKNSSPGRKKALPFPRQDLLTTFFIFHKTRLLSDGQATPPPCGQVSRFKHSHRCKKRKRNPGKLISSRRQIAYIPCNKPQRYHQCKNFCRLQCHSMLLRSVPANELNCSFKARSAVYANYLPFTLYRKDNVTPVTEDIQHDRQSIPHPLAVLENESK